MSILKDHQFNDLCKTLKVSGQPVNNPDRKVIEKAFRRLALKTHPDKGGDPIEFKKINDAYNRLIGHVSKLEAIEAEAELSRTSVIIEISKAAVPKWKDKLKAVYGPPKTSKVNNTLFNGPYNHYKGKGKLTGAIVLVLYEDPEDQVPKIVCRCDNYMAWIQEQRMPLHLHVGRDKIIAFDQWRIMSMAEFGFVSLSPGHSSARHYDTNSNYKSDAQRAKEEKEKAEKRAREEAARKFAEEEKKRQEAEEAAKEAEVKRKEEEEAKLNPPWWKKYADKYGQGSSNFEMGETTPPPEDDIKVFSMNSNSFKAAGNVDGATVEEQDKDKEKDKSFCKNMQEEDEEDEAKQQTSKPTFQPFKTPKVEEVPKVEEKVEQPKAEKVEQVKVDKIEEPMVEEKPKDKLEGKPEQPAAYFNNLFVKKEKEEKAISEPPSEPAMPKEEPVPEPTKPSEPTSSEPTKISEPAKSSEPKYEFRSKPIVDLIDELSVEINEIPRTKIQSADTKIEKPTSETTEEPTITEKPKRSLSNLTDKVLNKSKIKKMKTKKTNKKKSEQEPDLDDAEKENITIPAPAPPQEDEVKVFSMNSNSFKAAGNVDGSSAPAQEGTKVQSSRKRPLEDQEVQDQMGKRMPDQQQARRLSSETEIALMCDSNTEEQSNNGPEQSNNVVEQSNNADHDQQLTLALHKDMELEEEEDQQLSKTLKTIRAMKQTLLRQREGTPKHEIKEEMSNVVISKDLEVPMDQDDALPTKTEPIVDETMKEVDETPKEEIPMKVPVKDNLKVEDLMKDKPNKYQQNKVEPVKNEVVENLNKIEQIKDESVTTNTIKYGPTTATKKPEEQVKKQESKSDNNKYENKSKEKLEIPKPSKQVKDKSNKIKINKREQSKDESTTNVKAKSNKNKTNKNDQKQNSNHNETINEKLGGNIEPENGDTAAKEDIKQIFPLGLVFPEPKIIDAVIIEAITTDAQVKEKEESTIEKEIIATKESKKEGVADIDPEVSSLAPKADDVKEDKMGEEQATGQKLSCQGTNNYSSRVNNISNSTYEEGSLSKNASGKQSVLDSSNDLECFSSKNLEQHRLRTDPYNGPRDEETAVNNSPENDDTASPPPSDQIGSSELRRKKSASFDEAEKWIRERYRSKKDHENKLQEENFADMSKNDEEENDIVEVTKDLIKNYDNRQLLSRNVIIKNDKYGVMDDVKNDGLKDNDKNAQIKDTQSNEPTTPTTPKFDKCEEHWFTRDVKEFLKDEDDANNIVNKENVFDRTLSPPRDYSSTIPSRFKTIVGSKNDRFSPSSTATPPRRGSVFERLERQNSVSSNSSFSRKNSISSSISQTPTIDLSRATSPFSSRTTSPEPQRMANGHPSGKPYFSPSRMATVVSKPEFPRSKSNMEISPDHAAGSSPKKPDNTSNYESRFDRAKSLHRDTQAFTSKSAPREEIPKSRQPSPIKEFSPVILVRPSTFIQAMSPTAAQRVATSLANKGNEKDKIPSRFRRAMQHPSKDSKDSSGSSGSGMTRSRSIHELHEASLGAKANSLQDQIRQARADHLRAYDDAASHTHYTTKRNGYTAPSERARRGSPARSEVKQAFEALGRTSSMRSLRSSPNVEYRRL